MCEDSELASWPSGGSAPCNIIAWGPGQTCASSQRAGFAFGFCPQFPAEKLQYIQMRGRCLYICYNNCVLSLALWLIHSFQRSWEAAGDGSNTQGSANHVRKPSLSSGLWPSVWPSPDCCWRYLISGEMRPVSLPSNKFQKDSFNRFLNIKDSVYFH